MKKRIPGVPFRIAVVFGLAVAFAAVASAHGQSALRVEGTINDYSDTLSDSGSWHITGAWSASVNTRRGKADFVASLEMLRDGSGASPHTHHVVLFGATVTPVGDGTGYVVRGPATIMGNGSLAGFSGSNVKIEILGNSAVFPSNVKITFEDGAAGHFGADPIDGVVVVRP